MPGFDQNAQERLKVAFKAEAKRLGFDACGVSRAERLDAEAERLEAWLKAGFHGTMGWMENHFDKRVDPRELVPGAQTVISLLHNYWVPVEHPDDPTVGKVSRYAWNDDYHDVLKEKLFALYDWLGTEAGGVDGRVFVDSAPVLDKAWAARAGLGWLGKHSNLLNRDFGSFFFIAELIVDVPLPPDGPMPDYCGTCTRCIDACPTDAIVQPYVVDANRCISYLTIEHRGDHIDPALRPLVENWIYGCDVCQDVCPWNKFKRPTDEQRFWPRPGVVDTDVREWLELDIEEWRRRFRKSPVKRAKYEGFMRNVRRVAANVLPAEDGEA